MKSKRKAADEDDITSEAQQRAQHAAVHVPSNLPAALPSAAAFPSSSRSAAEDIQSNAEHVAVHMHGVSSPSDSTAAPSSPAAAAPPPPPTVVASSSATGATSAVVQTPPLADTSFNRLADIEVQLIMQQLDQPDLLRSARCNRALFRCAASPFVWQRLPFDLNVNGSEIECDPRHARSLLRFAPSSACVCEMESSETAVSCATLIRVPKLVEMNFSRTRQPLMQLDEWHLFLQHPNAQRLTRVDVAEQPALCGTDSLSLLSRLPLLRTLYLFVPVTPSASHFEPLVNAPSLTSLTLWGSDDTIGQPVLGPLARCTRLRILQLSHLSLSLGHLSETLSQLAQAGGQLQKMWFNGVRTFPMNDSTPVDEANEADEAVSLELSLAASSLLHLHTLAIISAGPMPLEYLPSLPSLRMLDLTLELLPSAPKLELLLRRLPHLHCTVHPFRFSSIAGWQQHTDAMLPQLQQLAQRCPRFVIEEDEGE